MCAPAALRCRTLLVRSLDLIACFLPLPPPLWQIGALIHFNMATYGPCHANASAFNPVKLSTDQWVESFQVGTSC
jgi:hypothetical protein